MAVITAHLDAGVILVATPLAPSNKPHGSWFLWMLSTMFTYWKNSSFLFSLVGRWGWRQQGRFFFFSISKADLPHPWLGMQGCRQQGHQQPLPKLPTAPVTQNTHPPPTLVSFLCCTWLQNVPTGLGLNRCWNWKASSKTTHTDWWDEWSSGRFSLCSASNKQSTQSFR